MVKARIRSVIYESGIPGSSSAIYRLYVFDVKMSSGKNFKNVKSVYSSDGGVADLILEPEVGGSGANIAKIKDPQINSLIIDTGKPLSSASNLNYKYRTLKTNQSTNTAGIISIQKDTGSVWPYAGVLTSTEEKEIIIIPEDNLINTANISGSASGSGTTLTGTATDFVSELESGDYLYINSSIVRVTGITNSTSLEYSPSGTISSSNAAIVLPANIPVSLDRTSRTANVSGDYLNIDLNISLTSSANVATIVNQKVENGSSVQKTINRNSYVKIQANTHAQGISGPWCLGLSDIVRLKNVYAGSNTSATNITQHFYIDHNQNENYYDVGYLYKKPTSTYTIGSDDMLLVELDVFTHASSVAGPKTVSSYNIDDELTLTQLDTSGVAINTLEIPEVMSKSGDYYDLRDCIDFRPITDNTANIESDYTLASINPSEITESSRFSGTKKFIIPEGDLFLNYSYYIPRADTILLNSDATFEVQTDVLQATTSNPNEIVLYSAIVPPYPSLPYNLSDSMVEIADKKIANESYLNTRIEKYTIRTQYVNEQTSGYTMQEVAQLERRIESLEYYNNLTLTENEVKDRVIHSSVDSTLERFKFGFFVDNYQDYNLIDNDNPENDATVYDFKLHPSRKAFNIGLKIAEKDTISFDGTKIKFPYTKETIISQKNATDGPIVTVANTVTAEPTITTTSQWITSRSIIRGDVESDIFILSSNSESDSQLITIKYDVFRGSDRFEIYQSEDQVNWTAIWNKPR